MLGVVILTNPTLIFFWIEEDRGYNMNDYPYFWWGVLAALTQSISSGFAYLCMRKLGGFVDPMTNLVYFGLISVNLAFLTIKATDDNLEEELSWYAIMLIIILSIFGFTAEYGTTKALAMDKAGRMAALNYI